MAVATGRPVGPVLTAALAAVLVVGGAVLWTLPLTTGNAHAWLGAALVVVTGFASLAVLLRARRTPSRRVLAYVAVTSLVLMTLFAIGSAYRLAGDATPLVGSPGAIVMTVGAVVGGATWLASVALAALQLVTRQRPRTPARTRRPLGWVTVSAVMLALWLPAVLLLLPGSTTYDGTRQLDEWWRTTIPELGFTYGPTNHHPWFATVWQGLLLSAGMAVSGGDVNAGLLTHSIVLVLASLATCTVVVLRIQAWCGRGAGIAALLFGLIPHFADYAVLYEKTGWYQLAILWFFLGLADLVLQRGRPAAVAAELVLGGVLTSLFRANGVIIVLGSLVVVLLCSLRPRRTRALVLGAAAAAAVVAVTVSWNVVALPRLGVEPASPGETLVVPFQQVARIVAEHGDELTPADRAAIDAVLPLDRIAAVYDPENGDGVKGLYEIDTFLITDVGIERMASRGEWWRDDAVAARRAEFLRTWVGLVARYPETAVSATVANTYLYVSPPLGRGDDISLFTGGLPDYFVLRNAYTDDYRHLLGEEANGLLVRYDLLWARTPVVNMLVNPGLYGWIVVAMSLSLCFWPSRRRLALLSVPLLVYAVNFAGARNGDFRYTVPLVALLPVCLAAWWWLSRSASGGGAGLDGVEREVAAVQDTDEAGSRVADGRDA